MRRILGRRVRGVALPTCAAVAAAVMLVTAAGPAGATPVCTDGHGGGPPRELCGGRVFPEAENAVGYVQLSPQPGTGFEEFRHGLEYLATLYPRWVAVHTLAELTGDPNAVSVGDDEVRPGEPGDTGDGRDILVVEVTDHEVPDTAKQALFFSLSIHGNERGALEGGLRLAEDLAMEATDGGVLVDGIDNYESVTGKQPAFHEHPVAEVLRQQVVWLADLNPDGWAVGDFYEAPTAPYERGNSLSTDLNRQFPTIGRIDPDRTPLQEPEARGAFDFLHGLAAASPGGRFAHGGDIHGELNSGAFVDIMYPAGQFDSLEHRRAMTIAERTKSVIDDTLYEGLVEQLEEATGGNEAASPGFTVVPTKPAQWATVWDSLGYTDTGFLGDYLGTDLAFTGLDHEILWNHTVPDKVWTVVLQENHINATRAIIRTAMAYALTQERDFTAENFRIITGGRTGYIFNPAVVTDTDANGPGTPPGPEADGIGADGRPVVQRPYAATAMRWFTDTGRYLEHGFGRLDAADVAAGAGAALDAYDSVVLADVAFPVAADGRVVARDRYVANLKAWVRRGGNLVLTDKALHLLAELGLVPALAVDDIAVYQPFVDITDAAHPLVEGVRDNARQLVEAPLLGFGIGDDASPMTTVAASAFEAAGGHVVGTSDEGVSLGVIPLEKGRIVVVGAALPTPTEENDHRFGLRDYALTYTATFIMENALRYDVPDLGNVGAGSGAAPTGGPLPSTGSVPTLGLLGAAALATWFGTRRRSRAPARLT